MYPSVVRVVSTIVAVQLCAPVPLAAQQKVSAAEAEEMCPDVATDLVLQARQSVQLADMDAFQEALAGREFDLLIDVREPSEYEAGHIPGAINIPRGLIEFQIWPAIGYPEVEDRGQRIYLYCNTGGRASLSARSLEDLGFTKVTVIDMKLTDWNDKGMPLEKGRM